MRPASWRLRLTLSDRMDVPVRDEPLQILARGKLVPMTAMQQADRQSLVGIWLTEEGYPGSGPFGSRPGVLSC